MKNLFDTISEGMPEEFIEVIAENGNSRIERIILHGHSSKEGLWYDQEHDEFVLLLQGEAELEFENETFNLKEGDYLTIRAHQRHRVKWTAPNQSTSGLLSALPAEHPFPARCGHLIKVNQVQARRSFTVVS